MAQLAAAALSNPETVQALSPIIMQGQKQSASALKVIAIVIGVVLGLALLVWVILVVTTVDKYEKKYHELDPYSKGDPDTKYHDDNGYGSAYSK